MGNVLLNFTRKYYDSNLDYTDKLVRQWKKSFVVFTIDVFANGFMGWLVALAFIALSGLKYPILGPGAWHILNIFEIGLIFWFIKGFKTLWRRK